jgi:hypothetical protein
VAEFHGLPFPFAGGETRMVSDRFFLSGNFRGAALRRRKLSRPATSLGGKILFVKLLLTVNNSKAMRTQIRVTILLAALSCNPASFAKEKEAPKPTAWGYVRAQSVEVRPEASGRKAGPVRFGHGTLVGVLDPSPKGGSIRISAVDPATLTPLVGQVEFDQIEIMPLDRFPEDAELLRVVGGPFLDDLIAANTSVARFLLRQGRQPPALVCLIGGSDLPYTQLQVFLPARGKFVAGQFLQFPTSQMQIGLAATEVRDLVGDGNECLISREPFSFGPESGGVNYLIRRIEDGQLKVLWKAPLEFRNLALFAPNVEVAEPPEENIGAPGTISRATIEFRVRDGVSQPVWKGKVEFHVFGREKPVQSVSVEKVCPWNGTKFAPLR